MIESVLLGWGDLTCSKQSIKKLSICTKRNQNFKSSRFCTVLVRVPNRICRMRLRLLGPGHPGQHVHRHHP
uniref:Uncharacterized protein n=1 Tax=Oryza brachyantha TaxID=4533 RepID=J3MHJ8_ORYBR